MYKINAVYLLTILTMLAISKPLLCSTNAIWFDDIRTPYEMNPLSAEKILKKIHNKLSGLHSSTKSIEFPDFTDVNPRIIFISISTGKSTANIVMGTGAGITSALDDALNKIYALNLEKKSYWIKLDIVQYSEKSTTYVNKKVAPSEQGIFGIATDIMNNVALLPEQIISKQIITKNNIINYKKLNILSEKQNPELSTPIQNIYLFNSISYFHDGSRTVSLYRGNRIHDKITQKQARTSAINASKYLINSIQQNGRFVYDYNAATDSTTNAYNILRHAGTVYSLLEVYEIRKDTKELEKIVLTLGYLLDHIKPCITLNITYPGKCVIHDNKIKLGANALAIIALIKHEEITENIINHVTIQELGQWIVNTMANDGRFTIHKQFFDSGEITDFESNYYPGEAVLALIKLYQIDKKKIWLQSAEKAADYIINSQKAKSPIDHDHWFLYALTELYKVTLNPKYKEHSRYIATAIMGAQNMAPVIPDWVGSYYKPPRTTPTAIRTEGLIAAYEITSSENDKLYRESLFKSIQSGIRFQLQTQYIDANTLYLANPERARYGFKKSLTTETIRIDYCQHNISSLLGYSNLKQ